MEMKLQLLLCLACLVFLQAQSYRLRDYGLRRFPQPHLREFIREDEECEDLHPDCSEVVSHWNDIYEDYDYCKDPYKDIQEFVTKYCQKTCNVGKCNGGNVPKPPNPPIGETGCKNQMSTSECEALLVKYPTMCDRDDERNGYAEKYCYKMCHSELCPN